jgi:hypothetical protein
VPFVLRFAHSLALNMWERSFLFSVACDYSLDPDHGWIHGTDVVAQTKLAPRSVPEIAKRFPELVERRRHHGNYFGYRFMLPASAPPIRSIAPRWTHDQEEAKYQLVTMNEISTADLKVSQSLLFRMLLYLCFRAEVDLTDTEIALLLGSSSSNLWHFARPLKHHYLNWETIYDGNKRIIKRWLLPGHPEFSTPFPVRQMIPLDLEPSILRLLTQDKSLVAAEIAATVGAKIDTIYHRLERMDSEGKIHIKRSKHRFKPNRYEPVNANTIKMVGRPRVVSRGQNEQDCRAAATMKPRAWCEERDRIGIPVTPKYERFGSWANTYDSGEKEIRHDLSVIKAQKARVYRAESVQENQPHP